jgi:hypothetical protein
MPEAEAGLQAQQGQAMAVGECGAVRRRPVAHLVRPRPVRRRPRPRAHRQRRPAAPPGATLVSAVSGMRQRALALHSTCLSPTGRPCTDMPLMDCSVVCCCFAHSTSHAVRWSSSTRYHTGRSVFLFAVSIRLKEEAWRHCCQGGCAYEQVCGHRR